MLKIACLLILCIGAYGGEGAQMCAHKECPSYSVVRANKEFEIRSYEPALWLSAPNISSPSYAEAAYQGSLMGNNGQHEEIDLGTTSVFVDIDNSTYTVYFSLPAKYQKITPPPPPSSDQIKAVKLPKYKYAAVRSGGVDEDKIVEEIASLKKSLSGTPYKGATALDRFSVAGYNSPFDFINWVDEVFLWFN